jgi:hypothetical protein
MNLTLVFISVTRRANTCVFVRRHKQVQNPHPLYLSRDRNRSRGVCGKLRMPDGVSRRPIRLRRIANAPAAVSLNVRYHPHAQGGILQRKIPPFKISQTSPTYAVYLPLLQTTQPRKRRIQRGIQSVSLCRARDLRKINPAVCHRQRGQHAGGHFVRNIHFADLVGRLYVNHTNVFVADIAVQNIRIFP